jgi:DNA repair photolyase
VTINELTSKSILIKRAKVDSLFLAGYGMNLYRGCAHACVYCDGQSESYRVEGIFGQDVGVKTNALQLLSRALDPGHHRKPFSKGFVLLGGGVGDSYQPIEKQYQITKGTLELMAKFGHPVHLLTKSILVLRDIDLLKKINAQAKVIISFSFSSMDEDLSALIEPGVPSPHARLDAIRQLKSQGLTCGIFLMPVIPFLTDSTEQIASSLAKAKAVGADFVIFGGMTLKEGRQRDYFLNMISNNFPELLKSYDRLYPGERWGMPIDSYCRDLNARFYKIAKEKAFPVRIPVDLCKPYVSRDDMVGLILEQMEYLLKLRGFNSSLGYVSYQLSKLKKPLQELTNLAGIKAMKPQTQRLIEEILQTGDSRQYQDLMNFKADKNGS